MSTAAAPELTPARAWILAARPAPLPAAVVPVLVGTAAALAEGAQFHAFIFVMTLLCSSLIKIGTNATDH